MSESQIVAAIIAGAAIISIVFIVAMYFNFKAVVDEYKRRSVSAPDKEGK